MKSTLYIFLVFSFASCSDVLLDQDIPTSNEVSTFGLDSKNTKYNKSYSGWNCGKTITKNNQPAFFIDGEHWTKEKLSELKPENIARIEVLKNLNEWKKYGLPENTPGVVVITTKKKH